jgi:hypothetical protein
VASHPDRSLFGRLETLLATPVSGLSLAVFRIAVGLVMLLESISLFLPSESSGGRSHLEVYYTGSEVTFPLPYEGFAWLPLLPSPGIEGIGVLLGLAAISLTLGYRHRLSATVAFLCWGYLYVVESTRTYWMSYYYLEALTLFLLIWMPAAARWSVDAVKAGTTVSGLIPFWPLVLLRAQLVVTYFYAGFAKVNRDWLLEGVPVRLFLEKPWVASRLKSVLPDAWAGGVDRAVHSPILIHFLGWSGAVFDLVIGFLLLFRRTRTLGMALMFFFHGVNHFLLFNDIVWFPLLGVTTALIFLEPDWPARLGRWLSNPVLPRPDWRWFTAGALAVPLAGALLGFKSRPTSPERGTPKGLSLMPWTAPLVGIWIVFQALFPLRSQLIPGDTRFTFEGLSWSWRLKTEVYRTEASVFTVSDPTLHATSAGGSNGFDWSHWRGEKVLYREVKPEQLDWAGLPELVVLLDPMLGDRILYNTLSASVTNRSEYAAKRRVQDLWTELYGHSPDSVTRTAPIGRILEGYEKAMRTQGYRFSGPADVLGLMNRLNGRFGDGRMLPIARRADPFPLSGSTPPGSVFLLIEDRLLLQDPPVPLPRINPTAWHNGPRGVTAVPAEPSVLTPMLVLCESLGFDSRDLQPPFYVAEPDGSPGGLPEVRWNLLRDVGVSKAMHLSVQPFLMRRYSQRVADAWFKETGRRPAVQVAARLSVNGHAHRTTVDPKADLTTVPVAWFGHNSWILNGESSEFEGTGQQP